MNIDFQEYDIKGLFDNDDLKMDYGHQEFCNNFFELITKHKALHLRPVCRNINLNEDYFGQHLLDCKLNHFEYIGGAAIRKNITICQQKNIIFTANEAPSDKLIPFHHELAQSANPPAYVSFFCSSPPKTDGETPILDSNLIYQYIHINYPDFESKLKKLGVRYTRVLPENNDLNSPIGRSWKDTYNVCSKLELENKLNDIKGLEYQWKPNNEIVITSQILPAIYFNYQTNQYIFHNSIIAAFEGWEDIRNDPYNAIKYGNGENLDQNIIQDISKQMKKICVEWKWEKGDIIWIDNRQVMHARNYYTGDRKIYASLWNRPQKELLDPGFIGVRNDIILPQSFGFWKINKDICQNIVFQLINSGYRRLDCACDYGNEKEIGKGIQQAIKNKICSRDDLIITSKLWNTYHCYENVELACRKSLEDLKIDYLDYYLIHFPISLEYIPIEKKYPPEWLNLEGKMKLDKVDLCQTWKAMERLVKIGLVKKIGLSNFNSALLRQIINIASIPVSQIQIEIHPYLTQEKLIKLAKNHNIEITAFSPLGSKSYVEINMADKDLDLFKNDIILNISRKYNKNPSQILLRWSIQRGIFPVCKSSSLIHIQQNINLYDFSLEQKDMQLISNLNQNLRFNDPGKFCLSGFGTFCPIYD